MDVARRGAGGRLAAVLVRIVRVTLRDLSVSGCQLESDERLPHGTLGTLRLRIQGSSQVEQVRISRCAALDGTGPPFRVGAEFLSPGYSEPGGLRRVLAELRESD